MRGAFASLHSPCCHVFIHSPHDCCRSTAHSLAGARTPGPMVCHVASPCSRARRVMAMTPPRWCVSAASRSATWVRDECRVQHLCNGERAYNRPDVQLPVFVWCCQAMRWRLLGGALSCAIATTNSSNGELSSPNVVVLGHHPTDVLPPTHVAWLADPTHNARPWTAAPCFRRRPHCDGG